MPTPFQAKKLRDAVQHDTPEDQQLNSSYQLSNASLELAGVTIAHNRSISEGLKRYGTLRCTPGAVVLQEG